jgi:acetyl-CoA carboxylase carboxyl transferase subunit beta
MPLNWFRELVGPRLRDIVGATRERQEETRAETCPGCARPLSAGDQVAPMRLCPHCGFHRPMPARERLALVFREEEYHEIQLPKPPPDPLRFRDLRRYGERLREVQARTRLDEALVVCHGRVGGAPAVVAAFAPEFLGGSMGTAVGEGLVTAARLAEVQEAALIVVVASTGARVQEGMLAAVQEVRFALAVEPLRERALPFILVLTHPTAPAFAAALAPLAHIVIAEPDALTRPGEPAAAAADERARGPAGASNCPVDSIVHRADLAATLARILDLLSRRQPSAEVLPFAGDGGLASDNSVSSPFAPRHGDEAGGKDLPPA